MPNTLHRKRLRKRNTVYASRPNSLLGCPTEENIDLGNNIPRNYTSFSVTPILYCSSGEIRKHAYEFICGIVMESKLDFSSHVGNDLVTSGHGWFNFTAMLLMFPLECVLVCVCVCVHANVFILLH